MNLKSYYFSHDSNANMDERLLKVQNKYGLAGYGAFWILCEHLYNNEGKLDADAMDMLCSRLGIENDFVQFCVDVKLFRRQNGFYFSERLNREISKRKEKSEMASESAKQRWGNANAMRTHSERNAKRREDKRKEEKIREKKRTYGVETETLFSSIEEMCEKHGLKNSVNIRSLDVIVERYAGKIRMKVELQHLISWLIDKNMKSLTTQRVGNWFKKAQEIQKRDKLKQLENNNSKTSPISPDVKSRLREEFGM